jgi:hypothetical protein
VGDGRLTHILSFDGLAQIEYLMFGGGVASGVCSISSILRAFGGGILICYFCNHEPDISLPDQGDVQFLINQTATSHSLM